MDRLIDIYICIILGLTAGAVGRVVGWMLGID
jgi:hypothetical protein